MENKPPQEEEKKPRRRVKKAKGHGGHHGGAWKVAYADFVTAMMALFLVLWLVSQADVKVKQAIASYFRSPGVFDTVQGGILGQAKKVSKEPGAVSTKDDEEALYGAAISLNKKISSSGKFSRYKDQLKIEVTDEGLRIQLLDKADRISFPSGSAALTPEAEAILKEIAGAICDLPNKINIGGHTDSRVFPSTNGYTNWELSADRANAARRVLESGCVKPEQIHRIVGFADTDLLVPDDPFSPANRRITITVLRLTQINGENQSKDEPTKIVEDNSPNTEAEKPSKKTPNGVTKPDAEKSEKSKKGESKSADDEKREAENKLKTNGAVRVGDADEVPNKPKIK